MFNNIVITPKINTILLLENGASLVQNNPNAFKNGSIVYTNINNSHHITVLLSDLKKPINFKF